MATRRQFLLTAGASTLAACGPTRAVLGPTIVPVVGTTSSTSVVLTPPETIPGTTPTSVTGPGPEPALPWNPPGTLDIVVFAWGLQTGDATPSAVLVSTRTLEPVVTFVVARGVEDGWIEVIRLEGMVPDAGVAQVEVSGLDPDTTWSVVVYAEDGLRRGIVARFRTALAETTSRLIRFGATSCLGGNEPWPSLTHAAAEKLDFFVLLGDTIYADNNGWGDLDHEESWSVALQVDGLRDLTASTSMIALWDDHEVDNDWSWDDSGMPETALVALDAFRRAIPQRLGPGGSGMWRKLAWGDAIDVFVLDCRGERFDGDYVSPEQLAWLVAELAASTARFKIVAHGVPICDMDDVYFGLGAEDRWDGYPEQRDELLTLLEESAIPGVVFLAGDFHWGSIATVGQPGDLGDGIHEVFAGPAGSLINPLAWVISPDDHYELVITAWNWVLFEADPDAGTLRVAFVGDGGGIIAERTLTL